MAEDERAAEITEEEFAGWLTPLQACDILHSQWSYEVILSTLRRLLTHGIVQARAGILIIQNTEDEERRLYRVLIVPALWAHATPQNNNHFWDNGLFDFEHGSSEYACIDVRFEPSGIHKLLKVPAPTVSPTSRADAPPPENKGGARRKSWWDDLWIEMIRRIRADKLHPESGKALEREMLDWLGDQGIYPGEETLKKTALKLFKYLQE